MPHIFLDESGQFTKHNHEKYFIVGSFVIGDYRRTEKRFRSWYKTKFPKKIRNQSEIKFSDKRIDENLRLRTLKFIADLDVRINYVYLLKRNIPDDYLYKNKIQDGLLYTNIIGETLEMFLPINDCEFRLFCDQRHLKGMKKFQFKEILKNRLIPQLPNRAIIQIEPTDSTTSANIQIADWISGAIARYLEKKNLGEECYQILKNNILQDGKELFKDYWENKIKNSQQN